MSVDYDAVHAAIIDRYDNSPALNTLTADTSSMFPSDVADQKPKSPYIAVDVSFGDEDLKFQALDAEIATVSVTFTVTHASRVSTTVSQILKQLDEAYGPQNTTALTFGANTYRDIGRLSVTSDISFDPEAGVWVGVRAYQWKLGRVP